MTKDRNQNIKKGHINFERLQIILLVFMITACNKIIEQKVNVDPVGGGTTTPIGVGVNVWQLTGLSINEVAQSLTASQLKFNMTLKANGVYTDSDGTTGTWSNPTTDSLIINQTNLPTSITTRYKIKNQSVSNLKISKSVNSKQIDITYESH